LLPEHLIAVGHIAVRSAVLDVMIEVFAESIKAISQNRQKTPGHIFNGSKN
jgi:hypothetical protein